MIYSNPLHHIYCRHYECFVIPLCISMQVKSPRSWPVTAKNSCTAILGIGLINPKQLGNFYKCDFMLYETGPMQWIFSQHCGYWWPGALATGHQLLQCWVTHPCVSSSLWIQLPTVWHSKWFTSKHLSHKNILEIRLSYHWFAIHHFCFLTHSGVLHKLSVNNKSYRILK